MAGRARDLNDWFNVRMCPATTSLPSSESDSVSAIPKDAMPSIPAGRGYEYMIHTTGLTSRRRSLYNVAPGTRYVHAAVLYAAPRVHSAAWTRQGCAQTVDLRYVITLLDLWLMSLQRGAHNLVCLRQDGV